MGRKDLKMEKKSPDYAEPPPPLSSFDQPPPYNPYQQGVYNQAFGNGPATVAQPGAPPPPVIIVQQPQHDTDHVPEIFETDSKDWFLFCAMGYFFGWCTACYLGMKYQLKCNWFLWIFPGILFIAGAVVYGVMYANVLANIYGSGEDVSINFVFNFDEPTKSAILN